jgi:hypothetical protein
LNVKSDSGSAKNEDAKAVLFQEIDGTTYDVGLPLDSKVDIKEIMTELGLPSYIDLEYYPMRNAIVTLWASQKANGLHRLYPQAYEKEISNKPISTLLFGGGAVKIHCQHSNGKGALSRAIKDMDTIIPKSQGSNFIKLLLNMDKAFGTQFKFFKTKADALFNAMRQGQRYRVKAVNGITEQGLPTVTVLDIFCDCIDLRHKVEVKDSFDHCKENLFTIGLEYLLLSKCQLIMDLPKTDLSLVQQQGQAFRILPYDYYPQDRIILGMEEKDARDVCAIFLDHPIGDGLEQINVGKIRKALEKDKKLALTVTLNLQNLVGRPELMEKWMSKSEASSVVERIQVVLNASPRIDKKWDKPWWNTAVETPLIE